MKLWSLLLGGALAAATVAHGAERSGKEVYESTCAGCHAKGVQGAPRVGDKKAWSARAAQGLSGLTQSAIKGIRSMPAHGGDPGLTDLEIGRAITHMVNRSGGRWVEPARLEDLAAERSGEQVVRQYCAQCHRKGAGGAPRIGDVKAWTPRLKDGLDGAVHTAMHGHGGMPPRGGNAGLTDTELRNAVLYMINPAKPAAKGAPPAPPAGLQKTVDGVVVYLGIVPAATLRAFPQGSPERSMHGGVPSGSRYYHVNVSLLDAATRARIGEAKVEVRFEKPASSSVSKSLEPIRIHDAPSYGHYVRLPGKGAYRVTVQARKAGAERPLEAVFDYRSD